MANQRIDIDVGLKLDKTGLNQIKSSLQEIKNLTAQDLMKIGGHDDLQRAKRELDSLKASVATIDDAFKKAFNTDLGTLNVAKFNQSLKNLNLNKIYQDFSKAGAAGQTAFRNMTSQILTTNMQLKQTNNFINNMATTMANTIKWGVASSIMNSFTGSVQKAYGYVKSLDTSLNDIRIVTGNSADEMERFAVKANNAAKALGQSTTNYTNAALIYYQQGLSDEDVEARAETTLKAANVTGQTGEAVSEQLTAVWNGYKVNAEEAELYIDKLAAVAATTASNLEELSTGMSKVASAANLMGVDADQLSAQLSTIIAVTRQAPESVGTALKTIYARMGDIEAGLDTETSLGSYTEAMKEMGINVLDANGKLRDMGSVIEEIGGKWSSMTREQQLSLAQTAAGTRQYNNLLALFDNWDAYTRSLETSRNAAGTLQKQQDIYMESTRAHLNQLKAASEDLYDSLLNPKGLNPLIDGLTTITKLFSNFVDSIGGGGNVLLSLGSIGSQVFSRQLASGIAGFITNLQNAKDNAAQLRAELEITNQYKNSGINDAQIQTLVGMKQQVLALNQAITNEERNIANGYIQQQNALFQQEETLKQNVREAQNMYKILTDTIHGVDMSSPKSVEALGGSLTKAINDDEYKKYIDNISSMKVILKETNQAHASHMQSIDAEAGAIKGASGEMLGYVANLETLIGNNKLGDETSKQLANSVENFKAKLKDLGSSTDTFNPADALQLNAFRTMFNETSNVILGFDGKVHSLIDQCMNFGQSLLDVKSKTDALTRSFNNFISSVNLRAVVQQTIQTISAVGRLASSLNSLRNIGSIISNEDLTAGEKLLQVTTSLGFALPMLATALGQINTAFGVGTSLAGAQTAALIANAAATQGLTLSKGQLIASSKMVEALEAKGVPRQMALAIACAAVAGSEEAKAVATAFYRGVLANTIPVEELAEQENWQLMLSFMGVGEGAGVGAAGVTAFFKALGPIAMVTGAIILIMALAKTIDAVHISAKEAGEALTESLSELESSTTELKNLESSLQSVQDKLDELYSKETLSITDQQEISLLEQQSVELQTQLDLLKDINNEKQKGVVTDTLTALDKGTFDVNGKKTTTATWKTDKNGNPGTASFDVSSEDSLQASIEAEIERLGDVGEVLRPVIEAAAKETYDQYHGEVLQEYTDKLETLKAGLKAAEESGDEEGELAIERKIAEIYEQAGLLSKTVNSAIDNAFKGDAEAAQNVYDKLQKSERPDTEEGWTEQSLNAAGIAASEIEKLKSAADAADMSIDDLVQSYKELDQAEIKGSAENNLSKVQSGVEGEDQDFEEYRNSAKEAMETAKKEFGVDDNFINQALEHIDWSKIDFSNFEESFKQALANAIEDQDLINKENKEKEFKTNTKTEAEAHDLDLDELESYQDLLLETNETLEENSELLLEASVAGKRFSKGVNELGENWDDFNEIMTDSNATVEELSEIMPDVNSALQDMLDYSDEEFEMLPPDFAQKHWDKIEDVVNGVEGAYEDLLALAAEEIIFDLELEPNAETELINTINGITDAIDIQDLEVGATLDDTGFTNVLNEMITNGYATASDITAALEGIQFKPEIEYQEVDAASYAASATKQNVEVYNPDTGEVENMSLETIRNMDENAKIWVPVINGSASTYKGPSSKARSSGSNKKPSGKKGGGGGGNKKKKEEHVKTEKDRYHDVNVRLKQIDKELEDIGKDQEKYFGKDLIKALNKELDILEKQKKAYKDKLKIAKEEQKELQKSLKADGVKFNSDGTIANYEKALQAQENALNKLIDKYNKLPAKKQEKFKEEVLDPAKEEFEKFQENIERYDEVLLDEIPDIEDSLQEIADREIEINVKKLGMEVELRLDLSEAQKDWNEFQREVLKGIDSDDILGNAQEDRNLYETLLSNGTLGAETNKIGNIMKAIKDIDSTGTSEVYGDDKALAMADLKKAMDELMGSMTDLNDLKKNIDEAYLDMIDEMGEAFDNQAESLEYVNELLEHNINLTELLHGDDAYAEMAHHYEKIVANNLDIIAANQEAAEFYKGKMETETDPEAAKKWKELWKGAVADLNASVENSIQTINDQYMNSIDLAFEKMKAKFAGDEGKIGDKSFSYYSLEWEFANEDAEKYLGAMDKAYELQKLQNKYKKSIDETSSVKAQRELNKLMDEEMKKLREKDKLTQYDIDRANAKYELRLKEIALEEAQQNKSQMRLRRDSSGNYSYQFVADEQAIADAQQEVADATHSLFEMDRDEMNQKGQEYLDTLQEWNERLKEVDIDDHEARALINKEYQERLSNLKEDYLAIEQNLIESAFMDRALLYDEDVAAYQAMSDAQRETLMNEMVPTWDSGVRQMMNTMAGPEGLGPVCEQVLADLKTATDDYNESLAAIESTAKTTFDYTKEQYDANVLAAQSLVTEAQNLVKETQNELTAVTNLKTEVDSLATSYATVFKNATDALTAAQALWEEQQRQAAEAAKQNNPEPDKDPPKDPPKNPPKDPPKNPDPEPPKNNGTLKVGDEVTYNKGKYYENSGGGGKSGSQHKGEEVYITKINTKGSHPYHISTGKKLGKGDLGWLKKDQLKFDTGGYTGDWTGNDGKTAILHKKELVLNAKDTENILATVNIVRDMQTMINSLNDSIISRTSGMMNSIGSNLDLNTTVGTDLNQQVSIQASFPGVSSRAEIEQAFENLVNMASQHAYNTRR